jgi:hypothetical protein
MIVLRDVTAIRSHPPFMPPLESFEMTVVTGAVSVKACDAAMAPIERCEHSLADKNTYGKAWGRANGVSCVLCQSSVNRRESQVCCDS